MNKQKLIVLVAALALIGGTGGILARARTHQRLGLPGIKTAPIPGSPRLEIQLPELVLDYKAKVLPVDTNFMLFMPQDTSIAQRMYTNADGYPIQMNAVLMGTDRTSIHKPEFCLTGAGWTIDDSKSATMAIPMERPQPYALPVRRFIVKREVEGNNQQRTLYGIYMFWFVADNQLSASHWERNWSMARQVMTTGVLQRWAYIGCFAQCWPGQEDATSERLEKFIQAAVPQFQLVPGPRNAGSAVAQTASTSSVDAH
ncbi:MAG TPA: exosortase-associated EpsI family protein [Verrucomicrobiae bacterium]|jgi:hypothetical protein|nr:exosortase-associated EpsI family protein [Verrucomicrobiae bacterium]